MGIESASYLDDLNTVNPVATDPRSEGDDHLRLIKAVLKNTFPHLIGRAWRSQSKSGNYTVLPTDNMTLIRCTAALTLNLTAAATVGDGFFVIVRAESGAVVVDPDSSELVNGAATFTIRDGFAALMYCDGSAFYVIEIPQYAPLVALLTPSLVPTGTVMDYVGATAPTSWLLLAGGTIGNAASGASARANADTEALFTLLWNSMADAQAPVSSGRGASAAADFAANKTITLPDAKGRTTVGKDDMGGSAANRVTSGGSGVPGATLGGVGGNQLAQQHAHGVNDPGHAHNTAGGGNVGGANRPQNIADLSAGQSNFSTDASGTGISIQNALSGSSQNMQPSLILNKIIKL